MEHDGLALRHDAHRLDLGDRRRNHPRHRHRRELRALLPGDHDRDHAAQQAALPVQPAPVPEFAASAPAPVSETAPSFVVDPMDVLERAEQAYNGAESEDEQDDADAGENGESNGGRRRKPPKMPMLFAQMTATAGRSTRSTQPVRGCAAHSRWLNPFLWVGDRWRRVVRRFYPFFEGNEVESAGNTFAHLEAERYSGGRRTLHVCDMATDTVLTAVLVNLQAQLAAKVGTLEEAQTIIDASRRLLRRDCIGGGWRR